jgi:very-long-chain ceramide synthase
VQTSKVLNYIDSAIMGPYFALFVCSWVYLRHFLNLKILWSILTEFATVGPYEVNWETQQYKCLLSQVITFSLLAALQALNLFWLFFIIRIAYRIVFLNVAKDDRSDEETEEEEQKEEDEETAPLLEKQSAKTNGTTNGAAKKQAAQ